MDGAVVQGERVGGDCGRPAMPERWPESTKAAADENGADAKQGGAKAEWKRMRAARRI